ncbi:integrase [Streptomyces sp. NBC_00347]|uniref:integrase n=1 Tax=Streptomyces sp. NBC_00347 TaxID=2975721 RepID=UPI0022596FCC|nr:integrase [Streptomyces sp. NBC_00347]MCX5129427.1 integrase [Streptomyces sp. NBC_00347]
MEESDGSWFVEFYSFSGSLKAPSGDIELERLGDAHARARRNGAREGTPILWSDVQGADPRVNLFFRADEFVSKRPGTWRRYAYALVVWLNFLEQRGTTWDEARRRDYTDFKHWRMADSRNLARVEATSFDTDRAGLLRFYGWAAGPYEVFNPISTRSAQSEGGTDPSSRRDPGRPAGAPRRQVKWLLRKAFEQWRDVGLRGYDFDGRRPERWRGLNEDRNVAFVEGLWGTGLRLEEWASVLDVELPEQEALGRYPKAWLAKSCAKGGRYGRGYRIPRAVLNAVAGYTDQIEGSRAEAIRRAQRARRYDRLTGILIVTGHNPRTRTLIVETGRGGSARMPLDVLTPGQRLKLFRATPEGLEPLALWLSIDGMPHQAHSWEKTFTMANERVRESWARSRWPGFDEFGEWEQARRKSQCPLWARPHMMRHSYALVWYSILSAVWNQRLEGFTDAEKRAYREQFGDVWYQLATLLGHRNPQTTRDWYLAPFAGLEVDYLMALIDGDQRAAVDILLGRITADSDLVLMPVAPFVGARSEAGTK